MLPRSWLQNRNNSRIVRQEARSIVPPHTKLLDGLIAQEGGLATSLKSKRYQSQVSSNNLSASGRGLFRFVFPNLQNTLLPIGNARNEDIGYSDNLQVFFNFVNSPAYLSSGANIQNAQPNFSINNAGRVLANTVNIYYGSVVAGNPFTPRGLSATAVNNQVITETKYPFILPYQATTTNVGVNQKGIYTKSSIYSYFRFHQPGGFIDKINRGYWLQVGRLDRAIIIYKSELNFNDKQKLNNFLKQNQWRNS